MTSRARSRETFLSTLTIDQKVDLENHARTYPCPRGTMLFAEGQAPQNAFILQEGQVTLSVSSIDGRRLIIGIARAGDVLGLASVLNGSNYEISAEPQYTCEMLAINRGEFVSFLLRHPSAFQNVALSLSQSYNQACTRFRTLSGSPTCKAKIARLLLEFSESGRQAETQFHLALNHQEIGDWVGMSRESVTRVLNALRRRNVIAQKGTCLAIRDRSLLERLAGERKGVRNDETNGNMSDFNGIEAESIDQLIEHVTAVLQQHNVCAFPD